MTSDGFGDALRAIADDGKTGFLFRKPTPDEPVTEHTDETPPTSQTESTTGPDVTARDQTPPAATEQDTPQQNAAQQDRSSS